MTRHLLGRYKRVCVRTRASKRTISFFLKTHQNLHWSLQCLIRVGAAGRLVPDDGAPGAGKQRSQVGRGHCRWRKMARGTLGQPGRLLEAAADGGGSLWRGHLRLWSWDVLAATVSASLTSAPLAAAVAVEVWWQWRRWRKEGRAGGWRRLHPAPWPRS